MNVNPIHNIWHSMCIPLSVVFSPSAGCGVAGAAGDGTDYGKEQFRSISFDRRGKCWQQKITSGSLDELGAGVLGAGDVGSGVLAPLESAWLSMRRLARDRVLYGNFKNVENRFRSSFKARSWRCWKFSAVISSVLTGSSAAVVWNHHIEKIELDVMLVEVFIYHRDTMQNLDSPLFWFD